MDFFKIDFFKNGFFQNGFFQSGFFSKWIFLKNDFFKMDFSKKYFFKNDFLKLHFSKMDFFKIDFLLLIFLAAKIKYRSAARVLSRPEARKKECIKFGKHLLGWACSAILAQLIYRFCGAIYRTGTPQRHEFDDHCGNGI